MVSKANYDRDPESCIKSTARSNVNYDRDPDSSFIIVLFPLLLLTKRWESHKKVSISRVSSSVYCVTNVNKLEFNKKEVGIDYC